MVLQEQEIGTVDDRPEGGDLVLELGPRLSDGELERLGAID